jgi:hypothetical protein
MATANAKRMVWTTDFFFNWGSTNGVRMCIGESGITNADARWVTDWDYWYARANAVNSDVFGWAAGEWWGSYPLAIYVGGSSRSIVGPVERNLETASYRRGVNVSQAEFGVGGTFSSTSPGVYGTDYVYPSLSSLQYMYAQGVRSIRVPFRWERFQNISGGNDQALNAAEVSRFTSFLNDCVTAGVRVAAPEPHNYMRYFYNDSGLIRELIVRPARGLDLANNRVGMEYLRNFWRRFVAAFGGHTAITGWDLMNEPHDMDTGRYGSFAVYQANDNTARGIARDNGCTHVQIGAFWDRLMPTSAGQAFDSTELTNLRAAIDDARSKDLKVILQPVLQYPPNWALAAIPQFRDQDGNLWSDSGPSGRNVRDWMWTQTGRNHVSYFIRTLLAALDLTKIDCIQMGGGYYGELQYPPTGAAPYRFWAYGAAQQSGTDLAAGMTQCPAAVRAPFVPYAVGTSAADNLTFENWWVGGLSTFRAWYTNELKAGGWTGTIYVLHPSWGMRRGSWTQADDGYREAVAQGQDWDVLIAGYQNDPQVWPWSTWIDSQDILDFGGSPTIDWAKAPWRKLLEVAQAHSKAALIWGENTGGQNNTDMDRVFRTDAIPAGYRGVCWLDHSQLNDGVNDTYANFLARIQEYDTGTAPGGSFTGTNRYTFDATTEGWGGGDGSTTLARVTSPVHDGAGALRIVKTGMTAGYGNIRADDVGQMLGTASGSTLQYWAYLETGTTGSWRARPEWQNASYAWQQGDWTPLVAGAWVPVRYTWASGIPAASPDRRAFGLQVESDNGPGGTVTVYIDSFAQGSMAGVVAGGLGTAAHMCEVITQALVESIRATGDTHTIYVPGYQWQSARFWVDNHPVPWIVDPLNNSRYAAHAYFDSDYSGTYNSTWADGETAALAQGFTDDSGTTPPPPSGDTTAPTISAIAATNITSNGAQVGWTTNENADSQVEYGLTTSYGQLTSLDPTLVTSHVRSLSNLTSSTTYHFRVLSRDAAGNLARSGDQTLTTPAPPPTPAPTPGGSGGRRRHGWGA